MGHLLSFIKRIVKSCFGVKEQNWCGSEKSRHEIDNKLKNRICFTGRKNPFHALNDTTGRKKVEEINCKKSKLATDPSLHRNE